MGAVTGTELALLMFWIYTAWWFQSWRWHCVDSKHWLYCALFVKCVFCYWNWVVNLKTVWIWVCLVCWVKVISHVAECAINIALFRKWENNFCVHTPTNCSAHAAVCCTQNSVCISASLSSHSHKTHFPFSAQQMALTIKMSIIPFQIYCNFEHHFLSLYFERHFLSLYFERHFLTLYFERHFLSLYFERNFLYLYLLVFTNGGPRGKTLKWRRR
jgi:hypothetical protein